jgi:MFS family permease
MFLIYALPIALVAAWAIGGRPLRVFEHPWRAVWLIWCAMAIQIPLFTSWGGELASQATAGLHVVSYGLLLRFMILNRSMGLVPIALGTVTNLAAIVANGGYMPIAPDAWAAAFKSAPPPGAANGVVDGHHHLQFLGDIMALPSWFPFTNVFSVGDVLIALGLILVVCRVSLGIERRRPPRLGEFLVAFRAGAFRRLWVAGLVSEIGDWMTTAAVIAWLYERGGTHLVAVALLVRMVPPALLSPWAGALADRLDRRMLMVMADTGRLFLVTGLAVSVATGSVVAAFVFVGAAAACGSLHAPAAGAYLPSAVPRSELLRANAILGFTGETAMVIGLAGGALIVLGIAPWFAIALDAATFAVCAILISRLPASKAFQQAPRSPSRAVGEALVLIGRSPVLAAVIAGFVAASFATGLVTAVLADHASRGLGFGPEGYGLLMSALSLGLVTGHVVIGSARGGKARPVAVGLALGAMGLAFVALADTGLAATAVMAMIVGGIGDGISDVLFQTSIQEQAPDRIIGRVFGVARLGVRVGIVASAGAVALGLGTDHALWMAAVVLLAAGAGVVALTRARAEIAPEVATT